MTLNINSFIDAPVTETARQMVARATVRLAQRSIKCSSEASAKYLAAGCIYGHWWAPWCWGRARELHREACVAREKGIAYLEAADLLNTITKNI